MINYSDITKSKEQQDTAVEIYTKYIQFAAVVWVFSSSSFSTSSYYGGKALEIIVYITAKLSRDFISLVSTQTLEPHVNA